MSKKTQPTRKPQPKRHESQQALLQALADAIQALPPALVVTGVDLWWDAPKGTKATIAVDLDQEAFGLTNRPLLTGQSWRVNLLDDTILTSPGPIPGVTYQTLANDLADVPWTKEMPPTKHPATKARAARRTQATV